MPRGNDETTQPLLGRRSSHYNLQLASSYFRLAFLLAAQRAFISCERRRLPAAVIPLPRRFPPLAFAPPRPARTRAQRARAAAAIFARAADDKRRFPPRRETLPAATPPVAPTNPLSRRSNASIWRRIDKACSKFLVDRSIECLR